MKTRGEKDEKGKRDFFSPMFLFNCQKLAITAVIVGSW